MKKKILIFVSIFVVFVVQLALNFNVMASTSSMGSQLMEYNFPEQFQCIEEVELEDKDIETSKYFYGTMSGWIGAYKYLDESTNTMYVIIMCTGSMQPNDKTSWDQLCWNNESMEISFTNPTYNANLMNYTPKVEGNTITHGFSINVGGGIDGNGNSVLSFSSGYNESYSSNEIELTVKKDFNVDTINIKHYFTQCEKNKNENSVCCCYYQQNHMAIYSIEDYDPNDHYLIGVILTCSFFRNGLFNDSSAEGYYVKTFQIEGNTGEN